MSGHSQGAFQSASDGDQGRSLGRKKAYGGAVAMSALTLTNVALPDT
jgi:hypothetical protein